MHRQRVLCFLFAGVYRTIFFDVEVVVAASDELYRASAALELGAKSANIEANWFVFDMTMKNDCYWTLFNSITGRDQAREIFWWCFKKKTYVHKCACGSFQVEWQVEVWIMELFFCMKIFFPLALNINWCTCPRYFSQVIFQFSLYYTKLIGTMNNFASIPIRAPQPPSPMPPPSPPQYSDKWLFYNILCTNKSFKFVTFL